MWAARTREEFKIWNDVAQPGEHFTFQIGVYANPAHPSAADVTVVAVSVDALTPASKVSTCCLESSFFFSF